MRRFVLCAAGMLLPAAGIVASTALSAAPRDSSSPPPPSSASSSASSSATPVDRRSDDDKTIASLASVGELINALSQAALREFDPATAQRLQQRLVASLDERWTRAASEALSGDELDRRLAAHRRRTSTMTRGASVAAEALREWWRDVIDLEKLAAERLSRSYRIEVYNAFRRDRAEFDRRRAALTRIENEWHSAGSRADDRVQVIDWLRRARESARAEHVALLPELPDFAGSPLSFAMRRTTAEEALRQTAPAVVSPTIEPLRRAVADAPRLERREDAAPLPSVVVESPVDLARPSRPRLPATDELDLTVDRVGNHRGGNDRVGSHRAGHRPAPAATSERPVGSTPVPPADRAVEEAPGASLRVDVGELAARIRGFDLALADVEEHVGKDPRTVDAAASLVTRLEDLARRYDDLSPYLAILAADARKRVPDLRSPQPAAADLAQRIEALRKGAVDRGEPASDEQRRRGVGRIEALLRRLDRIDAPRTPR